jgi:cell division protease FtsH
VFKLNSKSLLTGIFLLLLFFTLLNNFPWSGETTKELDYSTFLSMVDRGQVESVVIQGSYIKITSIDRHNFKTMGSYDPKLIDSLTEKNIDIKIEPEDSNPWYLALLLQWGPLLLLIGVWIFLMRKMPGSGKIMSIGKSKAKRYKEEGISITFKDVAGVAEAKEELEEIVEFLRDPGKFQKLGGKIPKGVLMIGPPGTGKTLLAKAVAGEAGVSFFSISGSDFVEMFVGVGASRVRDLFDEAKKNPPCIVFIDEIDAVGRHRGAGLGSGHDEREQTLNALLVEMDGFDGTEGIITVAATNRSDILDPALMRPGRFDRQVHVGLPDIKGREKILAVHSKKIALAKDADLSIVAKGTPGFSGAELENLVNESALWAAQQNKKEVTVEDMEWARDKIMMGAERNSLIMTDKEKEATAYHEAGHAIVGAYVHKADPLHKVTIIPRGQALGITSFLPERDVLSMDKEKLIGKITIALGGRAAEEISLEDFSTGVEGDLKSATDIAYKMICQWGMSENLGALTIPQGNSGNYLAMDYMPESSVSEDVQNIVDGEIQDVLQNCYDTAKQVLIDHKDQLDALAKKLLEVETVDINEINRILGRVPEVTEKDSETKDSDPECF